MTQCWFRVYISVCINTMSYYANLEDVQTYIMNYVMASKSVLVVYGATSISEVGH